MKKNKGLIITIIIIIIYALIIYFVFNSQTYFNNNNNDNTNYNENSNNNEQTTNESYYLVINDNNYRYGNNVFSSVNKSYIESLYKLKTFVNNKFYGEYKLRYGNKWNLLDDKMEFVTYDGDLIAASTNFNLTVKSISFREINDEEKKYIIENYDIKTFGDLLTNQVVEVYLDRNNEMDKIICLSNSNLSYDNSNDYNLILVYLNGKYQQILYEKGNDSKYVYNILSIINYLNNDNDSIVIEKIIGYISDDMHSGYDIYNYKNNNYVMD